MSQTLTECEPYRKIAAAGGHGLDHEGRILAAIRHPGVVALLQEPGDHPQELLLRFIPGGDLRSRTFPASHVAGIGAATATTLADLHDLGVVYNGCSAEHILLGADGAPVLCSFGQARFGLEAREMTNAQRRDVQSLIAVLVSILDDNGGPLRRQLQRSVRRRQPSARSLARLLASLPDARLPPPDARAPARPQSATMAEMAPLVPCSTERSLPTDQDRSLAASLLAAGRRQAQMIVYNKVLLALCTTALLGVGVFMATQTGGGRPESSELGAACPSADEGCHPVAASNGILTTPAGRWSLGESGDVVVLGRWRCTPVALPALLAPTTGQVWVFDQWAGSGSDVAARPIVRIGGATTLSVIPGANGCDRLQVVGLAGRRTTLDPGLGR